MVRKWLAALLAALVIAAPAWAWWDLGHRTVASIAWAEMTPQARLAARKLIAESKSLATPNCPIRNLEDAAVWPDCIQAQRDRFSYANSWHYQNIDICKPFDIKAKCPDGNCITAQIPRQARLLADKSLPTRERLTALAFLIHFMGDLHQPLHAGDANDRGGNGVKAAYGALSYERLNLHGVWDGLIAERLIWEPPGGPKGLRSEITAADRAAWDAGDVADWARGSWDRSRTIAYANLPADVCTAKLDGRIVISQAYTAAARDAVRTGVKQAGVRAALLINRALDPATRAKE